MKPYFLLKSVPELKGLNSSQRGMVHRICYQEYGVHSWKTWAGLLLYGLCGGLGMVSGKWIFQHASVPFYPAMAAGSLTGIALGFCLFRMITIDCLRPYYPACIQKLSQKPAN